jgi:hypothetical protein
VSIKLIIQSKTRLISHAQIPTRDNILSALLPICTVAALSKRCASAEVEFLGAIRVFLPKILFSFNGSTIEFNNLIGTTFHYLFKLQMGVYTGGSGTTIRHNTQITHITQNTAYKTTQTIKNTMQSFEMLTRNMAIPQAAYT